MKMLKTAIAILATGSFMLVSCQQPINKKNQQETEEIVTLKTDSMNFDKMKAELKEQYKIAIAKLDKEIDVLEAKVKSTGEKGEAEMQQSIDELKEERKALDNKMNEMENTMESTWEEWKVKAEDLLDKTEKKADSIKQSIKDTVAAW